MNERQLKEICAFSMLRCAEVFTLRSVITTGGVQVPVSWHSESFKVRDARSRRGAGMR